MGFQEKLKKYDKLVYGITLGVILPIIAFFLSYYIKASAIISFNDYFGILLRDSSDKMDIIIFTMIPNMFLFYFVNFRWNLYEFTKGLVSVTLILCVLAVITGI
jgi:hypothetical protein